MKLQRFLMYVQYTRVRPQNINPWRWSAMLRYYDRFYGYTGSRINRTRPQEEGTRVQTV